MTVVPPSIATASVTAMTMKSFTTRSMSLAVNGSVLDSCPGDEEPLLILFYRRNQTPSHDGGGLDEVRERLVEGGGARYLAERTL